MTDTTASDSPNASGRPRSKLLRRAILDAAFELERQCGYSNVTYKQIADSAHVGRQTIYRWWPSKSDLYFELISERALQSAALIDIEKISLEAYLCAVFKLVREEIGSGILGLLMEGQGNPELLDRLSEALTKRRQLLARVVERFAMEQGQQFMIPVDIVVNMLAGAMWYRLLMEYGLLDNTFAHELTLATKRMLG